MIQPQEARARNPLDKELEIPFFSGEVVLDAGSLVDSRAARHENTKSHCLNMGAKPVPLLLSLKPDVSLGIVQEYFFSGPSLV